MGWFFTKAALVTFGGAYAVLPYVYQGGVETHGWLTGQQMIDGLALGETTPGPLIMVVAFVGFVGGWTKELFGPDAQVLAGIAGASVATFFTFLPSFLFILVGAPMVEATRHDLKFTAPLTGITAAVVGVILNLALFFAWHVLWPQGTESAPFAGRFEWFSLLITLSAFAALWRYKVGIIPVIAASALAGLAYSTPNLRKTHGTYHRTQCTEVPAGGRPVLLDVRRGETAQAPCHPGATWQTRPSRLGTSTRARSSLLCPRRLGQQRGPRRLLAQGLKARYIDGGLEGWKAAAGRGQAQP